MQCPWCKSNMLATACATGTAYKCLNCDHYEFKYYRSDMPVIKELNVEDKPPQPHQGPQDDA